MSLVLCAFDASASSAFLSEPVAIHERLALKTVDNRSSVRQKSRLRPQTSSGGGSAPWVCLELLAPSSSSQRLKLAALNAITSHGGQDPLHFRHADQRSSMFGEPDGAPARTGHDSRVVVLVVQGRHEDVGRSFQVRLGAIL